MDVGGRATQEAKAEGWDAPSNYYYEGYDEGINTTSKKYSLRRH